MKVADAEAVLPTFALPEAITPPICVGGIAGGAGGITGTGGGVGAGAGAGGAGGAEGITAVEVSDKGEEPIIFIATDLNV